MSNKQVRGFYIEDELFDVLSAIKIDKKLSSKVSIIQELMSANKHIREGAFNYLNDYLNGYYKDLSKPQRKVFTEEEQMERVKQSRIDEYKRVYGDRWEEEMNERDNV